VLLDDNNNAVIADFGLARSNVSDSDVTTEGSGNGYGSNEIVKNRLSKFVGDDVNLFQAESANCGIGIIINLFTNNEEEFNNLNIRRFKLLEKVLEIELSYSEEEDVAKKNEYKSDAVKIYSDIANTVKAMIMTTPERMQPILEELLDDEPENRIPVSKAHSMWQEMMEKHGMGSSI